MSLGQDTIDVIHMMAQHQGISEVYENFTYEDMSGQEFQYDENSEDDHNVDIIDEVEENDHHDDYGDDDNSFDSENQDNGS